MNYYMIDLLMVRLLEHGRFAYCQSLSTKLIGQQKAGINYSFCLPFASDVKKEWLSRIKRQKSGFQLTEGTPQLLRI